MAPHRIPTARLAVTLVAAVSLLAACSSSSPASSTSGKATTTTATTTTATATGATAAGASDAGYVRPACHQQPTIAHPVATPVPGTPSDYNLTSFDGTKIRIHWFPAPGANAGHREPTILEGPGWSLAGDTLAHPAIAFGALSIRDMNNDGYNVLTWDPRGFGLSGGKAEVDSPQYEGRDAQVMLDWVAQRPEAELDRPGDPRVGMVGFSYGGGIQLTLASIDCRVDAIVPGLAWNSLGTSLYKADTVKAGWSRILTSLTNPSHLDPHIVSAAQSGLSNGLLSNADREWFLSRGPGANIDKIDIPTLFVQGTVDTLFTLDEAITNYRALRARGVPTAMIWFCGGHGTCLVNQGDTTRVKTATFDWLDRYLKDDKSVATGPRLDLIDQNGTRWTANDYPVTLAKPIVASGNGAMALNAGSASGPLTGKGSGDLLSSLVGPITPTEAKTAVNVVINTGSVDALALGAPKLTLSYQGRAPAGIQPTRVFAQLVDDTTHVVVGNQITPIDVTLDGQPHQTTVDLEVIAQRLQPGHELTLQLVATTVAYAIPRLGGEIAFSNITISIPVAAGVTRH